jgi:hypothetical protein
LELGSGGKEGVSTMTKALKNGNHTKPFAIGARGYTDAPPDIQGAMKNGPVVNDLIPQNTAFTLKQPGHAETRKMQRAWQRYRIKDHERGHRPPLSEKLKTTTRRFNTCTTLPQNVYSWIKGKTNRADYLRNLLMKEYQKTSGK